MEFASDEPVLMKVKALTLDPNLNSPIVILVDDEERLALPIWIGSAEANAIFIEIQGIEPERPLTHDLLLASLGTLGAILQKIVVSELRENTFYANLHLDREGEPFVVDSRPSDAIALALRADVPIYAMPSVLEQAGAFELPSDEERLRQVLEELRPEDLGEYEM